MKKIRLILLLIVLFSYGASCTSVPYKENITIDKQGSLKVKLLTDHRDADDDVYLLAGSTTTSNDFYLCRILFVVEKEPIKVSGLIFAQNGTATKADFSEVYLDDQNGEVVAKKNPDRFGNVNFDDLDMIFPVGHTSLFMRVKANSINAEGDENGTATFGKTIQFGFADLEVLSPLGLSSNEAVIARGLESGEKIHMIEGSDDSVNFNQYSSSDKLSKKVSITGSLLHSVFNALENQSIYPKGRRIIGEYKFIFDNGRNRNTNNEPLKSSFRSLKIDLMMFGVSLSDICLYDKYNSSVKIYPKSYDEKFAYFNNMEALDEFDGEVTLVLEANLKIDYYVPYHRIATAISNLNGGNVVIDANGRDAGGIIINPLLSSMMVAGAVFKE